MAASAAEQPVGDGEAQLLAARGKLGLVGFRRVLWQVARDGVEAELAGRRLPGDQRVGLTFPWARTVADSPGRSLSGDPGASDRPGRSAASSSRS